MRARNIDPINYFEYFDQIKYMEYFYQIKYMEYFHEIKYIEYFYQIKYFEYFDQIKYFENFDQIKWLEYFDDLNILKILIKSKERSYLPKQAAASGSWIFAATATAGKQITLTSTKRPSLDGLHFLVVE